MRAIKIVNHINEMKEGLASYESKYPSVCSRTHRQQLWPVLVFDDILTQALFKHTSDLPRRHRWRNREVVGLLLLRSRVRYHLESRIWNFEKLPADTVNCVGS